ncbi:uncharacterized protein LOC117045094 [Lacerta agilis]|uniref:uncharacterized protein LOC117045094 n=1 Tax=Lacerta agilis TaxID=80427 RepID=UPI00141A5D21|nr:uncharacterized protein LOC117045094 [Lacerta agilis]
MYAGSFAMRSLFLMLTLENTWAHATHLVPFPPSVAEVALWSLGTNYTINAGVSFIIKCPVMDCQDNLTINWYRNSEILPQGQRHNISKKGHDFVLQFLPISKNDSGRYQCQATMGESILSGHEIEVIVQESENATAEDNEAPGKGMKPDYLFPVIPGTTVPLHFELLGPAVLRKETSRLHQAAEPYVLQFPDDDPIYGNHAIAGMPPGHHPSLHVMNVSPIPGNSYLKRKEALIYATLSYGEPVQRHERSAEMEFTEYAEYAAIGLNH